jgi:hypothetical protein
MLTMVWAGTPLFLPILSLLPSWKYTFLLFAGVLIVTIPFSYNYFLESPRFLASQKCYTQAREIFQRNQAKRKAAEAERKASRTNAAPIKKAGISPQDQAKRDAKANADIKIGRAHV